MKIIKQILKNLSALTLISSFGVHAIFASDAKAATETMDIQKLLQKHIEDARAVGAAVALIDHGNVQFFTYGKKCIHSTEYISNETIFEIGSITKVFTTFALMHLVAKGDVQLDDPIEMYLPEMNIPEFEGKKITLRHLATHTSGLPRKQDNFNPKDPTNPYKDYTIDRLFDFLNYYSLIRAPGASFEYSNIGMGLLGHILSLRSGKNYEELIHDLIAKDMPNTSISLTPEMMTNFASGHHSKQEVRHWDIALPGMGALHSNIEDMLQFLKINMGYSDSPNANLLQLCQQKQHSPTADFDVGLGWMLSKSTSNHSDIIWHNGGTGGFSSFLGFNAKIQRGVVILSNSDEDWVDEFGFFLLDLDDQNFSFSN